MLEKTKKLVRACGSRIGFACFAAYATLVTHPVLAQLPTPIDPDSGTVDDGDFIAYIKYTAKDIVIVALGVIMTVGFIYVGYAAFQKFMEARKGRAEWAEVGLTAAFGGGLLVAAAFLFAQAETVIV